MEKQKQHMGMQRKMKKVDYEEAGAGEAVWLFKPVEVI